MEKKFILILLLFTCINGQNFFPILGGQRVGTSVYTFLKIGVSARAVQDMNKVMCLSSRFCIWFSVRLILKE